MNDRHTRLPRLTWSTRPRGILVAATVVLFLAGVGTAVALQPNRRVVNPDTRSNDSKPSLALLSDGTTWIAWHAYFKPSCDRVLAREVRPEGLGPVHQVSQEGTVHDAPLTVATGSRGAWVFWSALVDNRWRLMGRQVEHGRWTPPLVLSDSESDALMPAAVSLSGNRLLLVWSASKDRRFRIWTRVLGEDGWGDPAPVSSDRCDSFRPAVAAEPDGAAWVFWDSYEDGDYSVRGCLVLPEPAAEERISPPGRNCLIPKALATNQGVAVAWLQSADVINAGGAVGQIHTLHMALRRENAWQVVRDAEGRSVGATCVHGLTAKMEPKPAPKLGHMARLRVPMLLSDGDTVWLLWERKTHHARHPALSTADLAARPCSEGRWGEPVILQNGLLDYRLPTVPEVKGGRFSCLASELPRDQRRAYQLITCDVGDAATFHQEAWTGYEPVTLPLVGEERPRHRIDAGGKTYQLYWADLHNHSGLTCDAHGEPDELLHYARDRARLDAVALTDNDEVFDDPLTEAEYALSLLYARRFTREGEFLVLPGYEWTSHVSNRKEVDRSDPRNWDFRWFAKNCRSNHRTVIYPLPGGPLVRHTEVGNRIERLHAEVERAGGVVFPHQGRWDSHSHPTEVGVEVASAWGLYFANPGPFHRALDQGYRLAFAGNSDSHRRNPGLAGALTGIYAEQLTSEAILEALRSRRFYATNGSRIVVDSRANDALMGREVDLVDRRVRITLFAVGTKPIVEATLVRDGRALKTFPGSGARELRAVYEDEQLAEGTHWYYWRVAQEGESAQYPGNVTCARGHLAWSSPHWGIVK